MRIALINHDDLVILGIATMVARYARDIQLVDIRSRREEPLDLVLLDPSGGGHDAKEPEAEADLLSRLLADPQVRRVAVLTGDFDPMTAETWFARGYAGYLSTALSSPELIASLRAIGDGRRVLAPTPDHEQSEEEVWPGQADGLTEREADVLSLISGGLSNREIADQLGLSVNSVKSYIRGAYRTIDVDSRTKAVLWGVTHGLLTPKVDYQPHREDAGDERDSPERLGPGPNHGT